jgi:hypothetical protein
MANNPNPDRNRDYMREMWGTDTLITDYGSHFDTMPKKKMLREIANDDKTPKKYDNQVQNELYEKSDPKELWI